MAGTDVGGVQADDLWCFPVKRMVVARLTETVGCASKGVTAAAAEEVVSWIEGFLPGAVADAVDRVLAAAGEPPPRGGTEEYQDRASDRRLRLMPVSILYRPSAP